MGRELAGFEEPVFHPFGEILGEAGFCQNQHRQQQQQAQRDIRQGIEFRHGHAALVAADAQQPGLASRFRFLSLQRLQRPEDRVSGPQQLRLVVQPAGHREPASGDVREQRGQVGGEMGQDLPGIASARQARAAGILAVEPRRVGLDGDQDREMGQVSQGWDRPCRWPSGDAA